MKKLYTLALAAVAAFAFVGCENDNMDNIKDNGPAVNGSEVVFTASLDAVVRTTPSAGGAVAWTEDDTIGVWDGTNYVNATIKEVSGASVKFSAVVDPEAESYVAVTPADAWNAAAGDKVVLNFPTTQSAGKQIVSVAAISDPATPAVFKNTSNLLRFTVKKEAVKYAKLEGRNGEKFGATVEVDPATGVGSAATGSATEIVIPITTGENFVALPQGVNLSQGYTITLYGDEAMTDYQGEVYSSGAIALDRNQQRHLGVIDGWIDNWKLWEAGKSITIAGVEYSKASTGVAGELLQTNGADFNFKALNPNDGNKEYLYGRTGTLVYFLEEVGDYKFTSSTFLNIGSASAEANIILCSRYDNAPVTYESKRNFSIMNGGMSIKGVNFTTSTAITDASLFRTYNIKQHSKLHFDNCGFKFVDTKNIFISANHASNMHGIKSVKVVNSRINLATTTKVHFLYTASNPFLNEYDEVDFSNNTIWNSIGQSEILLFSSVGTKPTTGTQQTDYILSNNTFYNVAPYCYQSNTMKSFTAKDNIFCAASKPNGSHIMAYALDTTEFPYTIEGNVSDTNMGVYYFNPNSGAYKTLKTFVTKSGSASTYLKTIDVEKGIFEQTEAYKDKGAQKLF